jgi:hypothetical protein
MKGVNATLERVGNGRSKLGSDGLQCRRHFACKRFGEIIRGTLLGQQIVVNVFALPSSYQSGLL